MRSRREGWSLWLIALAGTLVIIALAIVGLDRAMRVRAMDETRAAASNDAALLAAGLESELNKFTLVPRVLSVDPEVATLLAGDGRDLAVLNRRLAALAQQTNAAAIYLMDARGLTLASSNWDRPDSFVGSNYGFRSYFAEALREGMASDFALGTVSRRPGLYLAQRVGPPTRPLGVVAIKVEFDSLESKWRDAKAGVFVTDGDGIVLLSSNPEWRFHAAKRPAGKATVQQTVSDYPARDTARDALRFGVERITPLVLPTAGVAGSPVQMVEHIRPIAPTGWDLHLLSDPA
ncbi:MAG: cache domain-containing protein, partial [Erythrobacter sp.]|nr:cache domain-containing protein [Erythrobacter sp.]